MGASSGPNVYVSQAGVNFKSVLIGHQVKETIQLVNDESVPFSFGFNDDGGEIVNEELPLLKFNPASGVIP